MTHTVDSIMALAQKMAVACVGRPDAEELIDARKALLTALQEQQDTLDFYQRRVQLLQEWQNKMRDPERTIACDIIANGQMLPDPHGTRYGAAPQPSQPEHEPENEPQVSLQSAQPVAQPLSLTDEMVVAAARVLCKQHTDTCGVDQHDAWNFYADDFKSDAREVLQAVIGIGAKE